MLLEQELIQLEEGFWRAAGTVCDFFREHMDALAVMASGVTTKQDAVSSGDQAKPWTNIRIEDPKIHAAFGRQRCKDLQGIGGSRRQAFGRIQRVIFVISHLRDRVR